MSEHDKSALATADRIEALEERINAIESRLGPHLPARIERSADLDPETFWVVEGIRERLEESGGVVFAGALDTPTGERYVWQQSARAADVLEAEWPEAATSLAALGHPVRLQLLQYILLGIRTTAELSDLVNTSGQLHHHLKDLLNARWLHSPQRGQYTIPPTRVIALLAILEAVRGAP